MRIATMPEAEAATVAAPIGDAGLGALRTERGNLPLDRLDVRARITGLVVRVELTQEFVNVHDQALEATYVFPLPDRAAVTGMTMTADGRVVEARLQERGAARQEYDRAIAAGQRASIAEEERPDVFTMRVGNILPGERVSVALSLAGPLPYVDGEATFRFPLVVAPRYVPGAPLPGGSVGDGYAPDTDAAPDASRITPPVLLPGFPNPLRLSIEVDVDPAGLPLGEVRSSLHQLSTSERTFRVHPGERADRDFVLRLAYGAEAGATALALSPDDEGDEGTYRLTVLPPVLDAAARPRDVVLLLDRSGSMHGWKMVAARRAAARIVDTLGAGDRFAVLAFDDRVEAPSSLPSGLVEATDRHRYRAVEHLARMDARGGTELLQPLIEGLRLLHGAESSARDRVLVLVTDGQVGNEDQILRSTSNAVHGVRVHTVGIDRAVNAGFLGRLAAAGGGRCELVESEDRLDEAMDHIHRRIGSPLVTGLSVVASGLSLVDGTQAPGRLPDLFPGVPFVVTGRYRGPVGGEVTVTGRARDGRAWSGSAPAEKHANPALTAIWARALLRDLEDRYVSGGPAGLEERITAASLRFGVLCRFTAYVAIDTRVVTDGGQPRRVVQPVELPSGWETPQGGFGAPPMPLAQRAYSAGGPAAAGLRMEATAFQRAAEPPPGSAAPPASAWIRSATPTGGGLTRKSRRSARPHLQPPAQAVAPPPVTDDIRELAAREAGRLREAEGRPDFERRELLEDLGSRLAAIGVPQLRQLAEALTPAELARHPLDELWTLALRLLEAAAGGHRPPEEPRRSAFWKR